MSAVVDGHAYLLKNFMHQCNPVNPGHARWLWRLAFSNTTMVLWLSSYAKIGIGGWSEGNVEHLIRLEFLPAAGMGVCDCLLLRLEDVVPPASALPEMRDPRSLECKATGMPNRRAVFEAMTHPTKKKIAVACAVLVLMIGGHKRQDRPLR